MENYQLSLPEAKIYKHFIKFLAAFPKKVHVIRSQKPEGERNFVVLPTENKIIGLFYCSHRKVRVYRLKGMFHYGVFPAVMFA